MPSPAQPGEARRVFCLAQSQNPGELCSPARTRTSGPTWFVMSCHARCGERQSRLGRNHGLFLSGCSRHASSSAGADASAPMPLLFRLRPVAPISAPAAAPPPIFVALLLVWPLPLAKWDVGGDRDHPSIDLHGSQPQREFSRSVQPSAGLGGGHFASDGRAGPGQSFAVDHQSCAPG